MTLRRTIAAALRTGALMSANVALNRVRQWERDDSVTPDRLARLSGINRLVDACRSVADLLDPHPTATGAPRDGGGHEPTPSAPVVTSDEQAVRAAGAAGEDGGHAAAYQMNLPRFDPRTHEFGTAQPQRTYRVVKGGRA